MDVLNNGTVVGRLDRKTGLLTAIGPELEILARQAYVTRRVGSCHSGTSSGAEVPFEGLPLWDKIAVLRREGFSIRLDSGQIYGPSTS